MGRCLLRAGRFKILDRPADEALFARCCKPVFRGGRDDYLASCQFPSNRSLAIYRYASATVEEPRAAARADPREKRQPFAQERQASRELEKSNGNDRRAARSRRAS